MKKSTALLIFVIYIASIILIGFLGMKVKVYDIQKYIKTIEVENVVAEDPAMCTLTNLGYNTSIQKHTYDLAIHFNKAQTAEFDVDGISMLREYISVTINLKVTYTSGELGKGESIIYSLEPAELQENNKVDLTDHGVLTCFTTGAFIINIHPESISHVGSSAQISVRVTKT